MADLTNTTILTPAVSTYYEKVFLKRAEYPLILEQGAQKRTHVQNEGKTINFTRYDKLTVNTTAVDEGSNPGISALAASTVSVTLAEYGQSIMVSKFATLVSIDKNMAEMIGVVGQQMGETLNRLVQNQLMSGTSKYGNGHAIDTLAAGDTLDACDVRLMVQQLELNRAIAYPDGFFLGKTTALSKIHLLADTTWVNAKTYSDVKDLYKGEMGELYQVRFLLNGDTSACGTEAASLAASTVARNYTFFHGADAFGVYDLSGDKPKLTILPNAVDSNSPAGRRSFVSWAGSYAVKILNSTWVLRLANSLT
jgi:N4-gp56 family major capsid protein